VEFCIKRVALLTFLILTVDRVDAQPVVPAGFDDRPIASVGSPTGLAFTPDGRLLITTQPGRLRIYANGALLAGSALDLSSIACASSEQGLLGVAVDPAFASTGYIYLFYTIYRGAGSGCRNRVSRFTLTASNTVSAASEFILIDNIPSPNGNHNGGDVQVGRDGHLYISVGDGGCDYRGDSGCAGANDASRDRHVLLGKILRITRTGGIPADNPFVGPGTARCNVTGSTQPGQTCQETFAWGLRNPFRIAFDPNAAGTRFFINDVGQNTWEEVDEGVAGADYGWNVREGFCATGSTTNCGAPPAGMMNPIYAYGRSDGCMSITGGAFVPATAWPAPHAGTYLFSDYVCGTIFQLTAQPNGTYTRSPFATSLGASSAVAMSFGPFGGSQALYYTTYAGGGEVRRIARTGGNQTPFAAASGSPTSGNVPLTVRFDASASTDADGDPLTYDWAFGDGSPNGSGVVVDHTYTTSGRFTAILTVHDGRGGADTANVVIQAGNTPPTATISSPSSTARFAVGQTITLTGSASDPEDGTLANAQLSWTVLLHHNTHTHPYFGPSSGNNLTFQAPAPEDLAATTTSYLEIYLTATDSGGATATARVDMQPQLVSVTLDSAPAGLKLDVNATTVTTRAVLTSWAGYRLNVNAPTQNDTSGQTWTFASWSDGGAQSHTIVTPSAPATYTATFTSTSTSPADVVLYASDTIGFAGMYQLVADGSAAGGIRIHTPDGTVPRQNTALVSPPNRAEWSFHAEAGRAYRLWIRGRAELNDPASDTAWIQFSGTVTSSGTPIYRIGTTAAIHWNLSDCATCSPSGWGWQDNVAGTTLGPLLYFALTGPQTVRMQVRDDGLSIDQIVLSPQTYLNVSPGATKNDTTIVPKPGNGPPPNQPPTPTISSPSATARFAVGQTITLTGSASDTEDGPLGNAQLSWTVLVHHNTHTHSYFGPASGNNLTFQAPAPEDLAATTTSYLEIYLTATDSGGASTTVRRDMQPQLVSITFDSMPTGLGLGVNGSSVTTPATLTSWVGYRLDVNAPTQDDSSGQTWVFASWSDGGAQAHTIVTPASPATYAATFARGSASSDIVLYASDTTGFAGMYQLVGDAGAAGGIRIQTPEGTVPRQNTPLAAPPNWAEWSFHAEAGRPYRLWIRGRAELNDVASDTAWLQFSGSVTSTGTWTYRIGTTSAINWNLSDCATCAPNGWGWQDNAAGAAFGPLLYFATTGPQTIRVQVRDDGLSIDQIVLSPQTYLNAAPGATKNDTTILPKS
jgi:glucose/arabinose dehydrogenase